MSQVRYTLYVNGIPQVEQFSYEQATLWYLTPGATYEFQVIARDAFGNAIAGDPVTVTMPSSTDTVPPTAPANLTGAEMADEVHMSWGLSTDNMDPQSEILYEFYLNGVMHPDDVLFGSSGFVYCREASGFTTVVARRSTRPATARSRATRSSSSVLRCPIRHLRESDTVVLMGDRIALVQVTSRSRPWTRSSMRPTGRCLAAAESTALFTAPPAPKVDEKPDYEQAAVESCEGAVERE